MDKEQLITDNPLALMPWSKVNLILEDMLEAHPNSQEFIEDFRRRINKIESE